MLFFMRSAVCIGLVVSALPDRAPPAVSGGAVAAAGAAALAELCRADPARCRSLADTLLLGDATEQPRPRKLRDQPAAVSSRLSRPAQVL